MSTILEILNDKHVKVVNYKEYGVDYLFDEQSDEYYSCIDTMEDYYKDNNLEMPKYAYGCYFEPIFLDVDCILENACEEHHEDMINCIDGYGELKQAIEEFNKINKTNGSYFIDYKTIVELF